MRTSIEYQNRIHGGFFVLACDHRKQFVAIADTLGASVQRLPRFKRLAVEAAVRIKATGENVGTICDDQYGRDALRDATESGLWSARPIEVPGTKPIEFVTGPAVDAGLREWPEEQVVKCLCAFDLDDPQDVRERQEQSLLEVYRACHLAGREFLLEIIPAGRYANRGEAVAGVIGHLYRKGIRPDWWKLEPFDDARSWRLITRTIGENDPECRGILLLGLDFGGEALHRSFEVTAAYPAVRGFAVGRAIVDAPIRAWLKDEIDDGEAVGAMAGALSGLIDVWKSSRKRPGFAAGD